jgi:dihydroorotate dehydrogenase electron transfer subunit
VKLHEVEVVSRERFGDHVLLRYRWKDVPPEPGQFVMARASHPSRSSAPFLSRPFFAHDHEEDVTGLLFEVRGMGTALLAEEGGAPLLVSGPLGRGFDLDGAGEGPFALVGGGVWVAPLKLLARHLTLRGVPHDVYLEVPATAHAAYARLLSESYPSAVLVPTDGSPEAPRVVLERLGDLTDYRAVCVSGSVEMLAAAREACAGMVAAQLALRERMACADGSCYGCAVPLAGGGYARACVEGPVFAAEEIAWPPARSTAGTTPPR